MADPFIQARLDLYRRELENLLARQRRERQAGVSGRLAGLLEQRIEDKRALIRRTEERIEAATTREEATWGC